MKKIWCFLTFTLLAGVSFANEISSYDVFVEGTAMNAQQQEFFYNNFVMEGISSGYNIVDSKGNAAYTFYFTVEPNIIFYDDGSSSPAPPDEKQYALRITLFRNVDNYEVVTFTFLFTELEEMYEYDQYLFFRAVANIPHPREDHDHETVIRTRVREPRDPGDDRWKNRWVYARFSLDFPFVIYDMQDGDGVYSTTVPYEAEHHISWTTPLKLVNPGVPGSVTFGAEVQVLDFLSVEPNFVMSWEKPGGDMFLNFALGAQVKYLFKMFPDFIIAPYGAMSYTLRTAPLFGDFPSMAVGGGFQISARAGEITTNFRNFYNIQGVMFMDFFYMHYLGDATVKTTFNGLFETPQEIHYKRFAFGISLGYKFGVIDRNQSKTPAPVAVVPVETVESIETEDTVTTIEME